MLLEADIDYSLQYDGTDDYVQVGSVADFKWLHGAADTSNFKFTIEFWMKMPNAEPNALYGLVSTGGGTASLVGIDILFDDRSSAPRSRTLILSIDRGVGGQNVIFFLTADNVYPNDTGWHHIVVTYDQSLCSANAEIFVDSVSVGTGNKTVYTPSTGDSSYPLRIGSMGSNSFQNVGHIEELRISDKVRSQAEIDDAYNSGAGRELAVDGNTIALWHFNEGTSSTAFDETANNHDGTITGASWDTGMFPLPIPVTDGDLIGIGIIRKS